MEMFFNVLIDARSTQNQSKCFCFRKRAYAFQQIYGNRFASANRQTFWSEHAHMCSSASHYIDALDCYLFIKQETISIYDGS